MNISDSIDRDDARRRWNCVCHYFGIERGVVSPDATGLLHDEKQYKLVKKRHRKLALLYHPDKGGNPVKFALIQGAWRFIESKYEPPIDITSDNEDEHPVAIDRQIERLEDDDQYNISLDEKEENDFNTWDLSQQKENTKAAKVRPMEKGYRDINHGGTVVVTTRWCDNDSFTDECDDEEVQREDNQNNQGKDNRQENSDKEVAKFKDGEQYWRGYRNMEVPRPKKRTFLEAMLQCQLHLQRDSKRTRRQKVGLQAPSSFTWDPGTLNRFAKSCAVFLAKVGTSAN